MPRVLAEVWPREGEVAVSERIYPFAAIHNATIKMACIGHFLGPIYLYRAEWERWSATGNTPKEALAQLVRAIEGPLQEWPEPETA